MKCNVVNLNDDCVVLGSGLAAASVITTLLNKRKKITIIDAGLDNKNRANAKEFSKFSKKFSSPKFNDKDSSFVYSGYSKEIGIKEKNFSSIGSLAAGGLSNIWGANLNEYNEKELNLIGCKTSEAQDGYDFVSKILTKNSYKNYNNLDEFVEDYPGIILDKKCIDILNYQSASKKNITFELPRNAIFKAPDSKTSFQDKWLGNIKKYSIFNSYNYIKELKQDNPVSYLDGLLILSITKKKDEYLIKTKNLHSHTERTFRAKYLFVCMGVLSTTKIILEMTKNYNNKIPLLTTPAASIGLISKDYRKSNNINLSNLTFEINLKDEFVSGNFLPISKSLFRQAYDKNILLRALSYACFFLLPRIYVLNMYFPSSLSANNIYLDSNKQLVIEGMTHQGLFSSYREARKILLNSLKDRKVFELPIFSSLLKPGEDIHYGGTIPISNEPKDLTCNIKGELNGYKNFYICDASSMKYLSGKPHSFNMMVHAHLITKNFLKLNS